jgi:tol-pal system protein YbgF
MIFRRVSVCVLLALAAFTLTPAPSPAANKEIQELQRDVADLGEKLKLMQQSQDRQLSEIRKLVQDSIVAAGDANKSVAAIQHGFQQNLRDQESKLVSPVTSLGSRIDQVSGEMRSMQQAIADLAGMISRMQTQLTDLNNAVKVIQTPPAPPPASNPGGASGFPGGGGGSGSAAVSETPPISATDLYNNAMRDSQGGKLDLAVQEFSDYLKWYGNTDLAPNAQYYIASIHGRQQDYEKAVKEYDLVLERYPDNNKTADALFGKGNALVKMGRRTDGAREFQELTKRFPGSPLATQACTQIVSLGFRCDMASTAAPKGISKRKK